MGFGVKVSVIGLGFVGSVTAGCLAASRREVIGVDIDPAKVEMLSRGLAPVLEPGLSELFAASGQTGHLTATSDLAGAIADSEMSLICIGVPTQADGKQDTAALERLAAAIADAIGRGDRFHSVVIRSTVLPGTTRGRILPILEQALGRIGTRFGLAHHPEFMREGSAVADFRHAPRTVIGELDTRTGEALAALYRGFERPVFRTTPELSEAAKYADNAWHALKVTFANEIGTICHAGEIDSHTLMELFCADTQLNISPAYLRPGFGFGGACLAKDLRALTRWSAQAGLELPLLSQVDASNRRHLRRSVDWLLASGRRRFAMLGLAAKTGTDDLRDSPFLHIARELRAAGREVRAFDPNVSRGRQSPSHSDYVGKVAAELDTLLTDDLPGLVAWSDAVAVCSSAPEYREALALIGAQHIVLDFARLAARDAGQHAYRTFV